VPPRATVAGADQNRRLVERVGAGPRDGPEHT
jgi:hypothetical protein